MEKTTVRQLVARFEESNRGFIKNTQVTTNAIIKSFRKWLGGDFDMEVRKIGSAPAVATPLHSDT